MQGSTSSATTRSPPVCRTALDLARRVEQSGRVFCHTFNYCGFPLVRQARAMVRDGDIGEIRMVQSNIFRATPRRSARASAVIRRRTGFPSRDCRPLPHPRRHRQPCPSHCVLRLPAALPRDGRCQRSRACHKAHDNAGNPIPAGTRRSRHDVGEPGRGGRRPRTENSAVFGASAASRSVQGGAEPATLFAPRPAGADITNATDRGRNLRPCAPAAPASATPKVIRRRSPSCMLRPLPRWSPSARQAAGNSSAGHA